MFGVLGVVLAFLAASCVEAQVASVGTSAAVITSLSFNVTLGSTRLSCDGSALWFVAANSSQLLAARVNIFRSPTQTVLLSSSATIADLGTTGPTQWIVFTLSDFSLWAAPEFEPAKLIVAPTSGPVLAAQRRAPLSCCPSSPLASPSGQFLAYVADSILNAYILYPSSDVPPTIIVGGNVSALWFIRDQGLLYQNGRGLVAWNLSNRRTTIVTSSDSVSAAAYGAGQIVVWVQDTSYLMAADASNSSPDVIQLTDSLTSWALSPSGNSVVFSTLDGTLYTAVFASLFSGNGANATQVAQNITSFQISALNTVVYSSGNSLYAVALSQLDNLVLLSDENITQLDGASFFLSCDGNFVVFADLNTSTVYSAFIGSLAKASTQLLSSAVAPAIPWPSVQLSWDSQYLAYVSDGIFTVALGGGDVVQVDFVGPTPPTALTDVIPSSTSALLYTTDAVTQYVFQVVRNRSISASLVVSVAIFVMAMMI